MRVVVALALLGGASSFLVPLPATRGWVSGRSRGKLSAATIPAPSAQQQGNDAFLKKDLQERARKGTGIVNDSKLKIGIVGYVP